MTLQEILSDIHALEEELLAFERKFGIRCETFYAAYAAGEEPEDWISANGPASIEPGWRDKRSIGTRFKECSLPPIPWPA